MSITSPKVLPGGIATVALLKTQIDSGASYSDIFVPLVCEVACVELHQDAFLAQEMMDALETVHGIAMPLSTVKRVLERAVKRGDLRSHDGCYSCVGHHSKAGAIAAQKNAISQTHDALAHSFSLFAAERGVTLDHTSALEKLVAFLDERRLTFLLGPGAEDISDTEIDADAIEGDEDRGAPKDDVPSDAPDLKESRRTRTVLAMFVRTILMGTDDRLKGALNDIVDGLVLYRAAFLTDLDESTRQFNGLTIYFDSPLIRHILGFAGPAEQKALADAVKILKRLGVGVCVFPPTLDEVRRILTAKMYAIRNDIDELKFDAMSEHFLMNKYGPGDIAQMIATLDSDVERAGVRIVALPKDNPRYSCDKDDLARRLAGPWQNTKVPRVQHDVACVAAVMTLRKAQQSTMIEACKALFVSSSYSVIITVRDWYVATEADSTGIAPMAPFDVLTNIAWLKRPTLCGDLKRDQLLALCAAALRPNARDWKRFMEHLNGLVASGAIDSDERVSYTVNALSGDTFAEASLLHSDDASTYKEVMARVEQRKITEFAPLIESAKEEHRKANVRADVAERQRDELAKRVADRENIRRLQIEKYAARFANAVLMVLAIIVASSGVAIWLSERSATAPVILLLASILIESFDLLSRNRELAGIKGWVRDRAELILKEISDRF